MTGLKLLPIIALVLFMGGTAQAREFSSPLEQTTLLELYTSEGCSSCPPADRWLSTYKQDARLWQQLVPVAFHVDYWNYLGWRDRFSDAHYSKRQYDYKRHRHLKAVYTPGLLHNGREFRGWRAGQEPVQQKPVTVGILKAVLNHQQALAEFTPTLPITSPLMLNVALLAFDQRSEVRAGENSGRVLSHDFVVVKLQQFRSSAGNTHHWQLGDLLTEKPATATGIALWVTTADDPTPLQATGGWLDD